MTGEGNPGDASSSKWKETFEKLRKESDASLTRLEVRAELKSAGEEELSDVIDRETLERQRVKEESVPPSKATPTVVVLTLVRKIPTGWGAVIVVLAGIAAYVFLHK